MSCGRFSKQRSVRVKDIRRERLFKQYTIYKAGMSEVIVTKKSASLPSIDPKLFQAENNYS
jgi:hypothetical protein